MRTTPFVIVFVAGLLAVLTTGLALHAVLGQPWLGITFDRQFTASGARLAQVADNGPAAELTPGDIITLISDGTQSLELEPVDLLIEPDTLATYAEFNRFFERQDSFHTLLGNGPVILHTADGRLIEVTPRPARPITDLPMDFWLLSIISGACLIVGACVLAFRRETPGVQVLALFSLAVAACLMPGAVILSRELAFDATLFAFASALNFTGAIGTVTLLLILFLIHPRRLAGRLTTTAILLAALSYVAIELAQLGFVGPGTSRYAAISATAILAIGAASIQFVIAKAEPQTRAALGWFGFGLILTTTIFVLAFALPSILGFNSVMPAWLGYALGGLLYAYIALSIVRFRMFDLEIWTFRMMFYVIGGLLWAVIDILLVYVLALDRLPAFGVALALVALFYLPLRDALSRRFLPEQSPGRLMFQDVVQIALIANPDSRAKSWRDLMRLHFDPLDLSAEAKLEEPTLRDGGVQLAVPGHGIVPDLALHYKSAGRRLFTRRDVDFVAELCAALRHAAESRDAYARGMAEERARIARDMHDNIGAKLLSALHGTDTENKNQKIRDALVDLRDIVNNVYGSAQTLDETLAELRLETAERLSESGLKLNWHTSTTEGTLVSPVELNALRSILREAVSNAIRHAGARNVTVDLSSAEQQLIIKVRDDGKGKTSVEPDKRGGTGLDGIRARLTALKGRLEIEDHGAGFTLRASFPRNPEPA